jgi:hypothetical protein
LGIPYKNGGPVALYINSAVISTMDIIRPLLEVEVVDTIMAQTCEGEIGNRMPQVLAFVEGL